MPTFRRFNSTAGHLERTVIILKPDLLLRPDFAQYRLQLRELLLNNGLSVIAERRGQWSRQEAASFYSEHKGRFFYPRLLFSMTAHQVEWWLAEGDDAIRRWRALIGPTHLPRARSEAPLSIRGRWARSDVKNCVHGSGNRDEAAVETKLVFPSLAPLPDD